MLVMLALKRDSYNGAFILTVCTIPLCRRSSPSLSGRKAMSPYAGLGNGGAGARSLLKHNKA
jgi:hypothetical protein